MDLARPPCRMRVLTYREAVRWKEQTQHPQSRAQPYPNAVCPTRGGQLPSAVPSMTSRPAQHQSLYTYQQKMPMRSNTPSHQIKPSEPMQMASMPSHQMKPTGPMQMSNIKGMTSRSDMACT